MIKYACTGIKNVSHVIKYTEDRILIIDIKTEILNLMCKKV